MKNIIFSILLIFSLAISAQTKLPTFFGDNMVLQQEQEVSIWGTDTPNTTIIISASWGKEVSTKADGHGKWRTKIATPKADKNSYTLTVKGNEKVIFNNVVLGEVWLCSGQSNMEMPIKGFPDSPINGSNEAILNARNSRIRLFHTHRKASLTPVDDVVGEWVEATPKTVAEFSALAYFFGKKLNEVIDVPIGVINSSWGGANAEAWTDEESLSQFSDIAIPTEIPEKGVQQAPAVLYNGMIAPFIGYNIRGAIWNQGESNRKRPEQYKKLLPALIKGWRDKWQIGDFPFYFSQVPPFYYRDGEYATFIVEAQVFVMQTVKNTGLATTTDIGKCSDIHAPEKKLLGDRLAYWALANDYGIEGIAYNGPIYKSMEVIEDHKIKIHFEESDRDRGLANFKATKDLEGFIIAGADKQFYPAKAIMKRKGKIIVWSDEVPDPVAVRYAFGNCNIGSLYNTAGIPAACFRTDKWDDVMRKDKE